MCVYNVHDTFQQRLSVNRQTENKWLRLRMLRFYCLRASIPVYTEVHPLNLYTIELDMPTGLDSIYSNKDMVEFETRFPKKIALIDHSIDS